MLSGTSGPGGTGVSPVLMLVCWDDILVSPTVGPDPGIQFLGGELGIAHGTASWLCFPFHNGRPGSFQGEFSDQRIGEMGTCGFGMRRLGTRDQGVRPRREGNVYATALEVVVVGQFETRIPEARVDALVSPL